MGLSFRGLTHIVIPIVVFLVVSLRNTDGTVIQGANSPGKPTDNAMVESFNGRLRQECLNEHWFMSLQYARNKIEAWRGFYNEERAQSALDWQTPKEFALKNGLNPVFRTTRSRIY
jgi:hypothetical protein